MSGFENDVMLAKNLNFDEAGAKPHLGIINAAGKFPIGTGNTQPTPEILGGTITSPGATLTIGYSSPNITIDVNSGTIGETITGQTGGALSPTAGNWNIFGNNNAQNGFASFTTGSASTLTIHSFGVAKWVVNPLGSVGTHQTIQTAINSAVSGETVFITPGTYTENITLKAGVNLSAFDCDAQTPNVTIVGKLSFSSAGTVAISGINLQTNSDNVLAVTGSAASIVVLTGCNFSIANNTAISYTTANASSQVKLFRCTGNISTTGITLFSASATGRLAIFHSRFTNTGVATTASTMSAGILDIHWSQFDFPITTSGTNTCGTSHAEFNSNVLNTTAFTYGGSGTSSSSLDYFASGTASAISIGAITGVSGASVQSSNTNAITGASQISYGTISFISTSSTINTTTQIPYVQSNDAIKVVTPGAYPYTTTPQDAIIKVDTSSARTITPLASPTTGQMHIIKDTVGSAGANNITVTPSGKNIDGVASKTINTNYGSMTIVYNGTEWSII